MIREKAADNLNSVRKNPPRGKWMAPGIGIGATMGIF